MDYIVLHLHHAAEAHEGHGEDARRDQCDGDAAHAGRELGARQLLTDASENDQREREAKRDGDGIDDAFH